jgi:hypothetical protein
MERFKTTTKVVEVFAGRVCDGCGLEDPHGYETMEVVISVHANEEGGSVDRYDYCDDCLVERAPALKAAGSRAFLVTGEEVFHE